MTDKAQTDIKLNEVHVLPEWLTAPILNNS
jgi:hypothetical protein